MSQDEPGRAAMCLGVLGVQGPEGRGASCCECRCVGRGWGLLQKAMWCFLFSVTLTVDEDRGKCADGTRATSSDVGVLREQADISVGADLWSQQFLGFNLRAL